MSGLTIDPEGLKAMVKACQTALESEVDEVIVPFSKFAVRVDTGRLRESIDAKPSRYSPRYRMDDGTQTKAVVMTVTLGGTEQLPTARIDSLGNRLVDYAEDLENHTQNLSRDIFGGLDALYN